MQDFRIATHGVAIFCFQHALFLKASMLDLIYDTYRDLIFTKYMVNLNF